MRTLSAAGEVIVVFVFSALCCGCEGKRTDAPFQIVHLSASEGENLSCSDGFEVETPIGRLVNNVWNKQAIKGEAYSQCLRMKKSGEASEFGWSWSWPEEAPTFLAFPQVVFGWKPWSGGESKTPMLPIRIRDINTMQLNYTMQVSASGKHTISTALWLTRSGKTGANPDPSDISADVNIWTEGFDFSPLGTLAGRVNIGDDEFDVWSATGMTDASGANTNSWNHVVYRSLKPHHAASLDLKRILEDAAARQLISVDHYVSSVEVGNEVISGSGQTWVKALSLQVE